MSNIAKKTIGVMAITIIAKILGFVRELVLASQYGTSSYSDAYLVALNIPTVAFAGIGVALSTSFIPLFFEINNNNGVKKSLKFTNNTMNIILILSTMIAIVGFIFAENIVQIFAIGFQGETLAIATNFARIIIVSIVFISISNIMSSYLQTQGVFVSSVISNIPYNIIIIIFIMISVKYNPYMMAWGALFAIIIQSLCNIIFAMKNKYKYELTLDLGDKYLKKMIWLVIPVFIGVAVNQINVTIDRSLASTLAGGSISALNYANKLNGFVMAIFITSISIVVYPILSKLSIEDNKVQFTKSIVKSINSVIVLIIPIAVGAMVLSTPIVKLLFERGEFDAQATNMTAIALTMYSVGMVAFGVRDILGKVFYSLQDTKTPMLNGVIATLINIILNILLVRYLKLAGLALATSISATICIFLLFGSLKKKIGYFGQDKIIKTTIKSILSSVFMGIVTYFTYDMISNLLGIGFIKEVISLVVSVGVGAITYAILIIVLKVEEADIITSMMKKKLNKAV